MFKPQQKEELRQRMQLHHQMNPSLRPTKTVPYGTAGFRGPAKEVGWIFYRAGILAALKCFDSRETIGVMITASHNHIDDNGIKFIDGNGFVMSSSWELIMDKVCNIIDIDAFIAALDEVVKSKTIYCDVKPTRGQVFIGYDTRPTSEFFAKLVTDGIRAIAERLIKVTNLELCTTPELHWLVGEANQRGYDCPAEIPKRLYWEKAVSATQMGLNIDLIQENEKKDHGKLVVDCANGVGKEIMALVKRFLEYDLPMELINVGSGVLNESCGADYVKSNHKPVVGADQLGVRYASLDGDADRLVYFYLHKDKHGKTVFRLLDGDRIQALFAAFMAQIFNDSRYNGMLSMACIQTAYANGACTDFLKKTGFRVDCVDTGVNNLHRQAMKYDIGIYFEANGHGTIYLSKRARELFTEQIKDLDTPHDRRWEPSDEEVKKNQSFKVLGFLVNFYVGDGIRDMLLVELMLRYFDWDIGKWYGLYQDRPSRLIKLAVKDKNLLRTVDAGRKVCSPPGLQAEIDAIMAGFGPHARAFVRASGTENVVRVYAEASKQEIADEIADLIGRKTKEYCD